MIENLTTEQIEFLKEMGEFNPEQNHFETMYNLQAKFDKSLEEKRGLNFENLEYRKLTVYALLSETAELLDELSWPWWKEVEEDKQGVINELRDLQHFILKLMKLEGLEPKDIYDMIKGEFEEEEVKGKNDVEVLYLGVEKSSDFLKESEIETMEDKVSYLFYLISNLHSNYIYDKEDYGEDENHENLFIVGSIQVLILTLFKDCGYGLEDVFLAYIDKNIENHNRQKGKSKDATRNNYSKEGSKVTFEKTDDGFIIENENGEKFHLTKETLFELNRK